MKQTPPIPPNNPRFRDDILYSGCTYYLCPGTQLIALNGGCEEIPDQWRPIIAADAEVAWRKEHARLGEELNRIPRSHHMLAVAKMSLLCDARDAAAAWRSWAEPEIESEEDHEPE